MGRQRSDASGKGYRSWNRSGITPTTMYFRPLSERSRPTIDESAPNRWRHNAYESTTTEFLPVVATSGTNTRPSIGRVPSVWKKSRETAMPRTRIGSSPPVRFGRHVATAATPSNTAPSAIQSAYVPADTSFLPGATPPSARGGDSHSATRRSGSAYGSARINNGLTTLNNAVLAATATAIVRITTEENPGLERSERTRYRRSRSSVSMHTSRLGTQRTVGQAKHRNRSSAYRDRAHGVGWCGHVRLSVLSSVPVSYTHLRAHETPE